MFSLCHYRLLGADWLAKWQCYTFKIASAVQYKKYDKVKGLLLKPLYLFGWHFDAILFTQLVTYVCPLLLFWFCVTKLWTISVLPQAFWKEKDFSGEIVAGSSTNCPFSATFDATSPSGNAALVGFIAGKQASQWSSKEVISYQCIDRFSDIVFIFKLVNVLKSQHSFCQ